MKVFSFPASLASCTTDDDDDAFSISTAWMRKISQFWLSQLSGLSICTACTLIVPPCIVICGGSTSFRFTALECTLALIPFKGGQNTLNVKTCGFLGDEQIFWLGDNINSTLRHVDAREHRGSHHCTLRTVLRQGNTADDVNSPTENSYYAVLAIIVANKARR